MKVRFCARDDQMCPYPNQYLIPGNPQRMINRDFVPGVVENGETKIQAQHPAREEPEEFEAESDEGRRAIEFCARDGALWPADQETAQICGVSFVPVEWADGVWAPKKKSSGKTAAKD